VRLFAAGAAPLLLLSGGGRDAEPEAAAMRALALAAGVPEAAIVIEPRSRDTLGNARECALLLKARGLRRVVLVSDRAHLPRAALLFRLAGLEVVARSAALPPSRGWGIGARLREAAALPKSLLRALVLRRRGR
jgi:uncharacterized SAM-binding protein YcdF (DUF218 family)